MTPSQEELHANEPVKQVNQEEVTTPEQTEAPAAEAPAEEPQPEAEAPAAEESQPEAEAPAAEEPQPEAEAPAAEEPQPEAEAPAAEEPQPEAEAPAAEEPQAEAEVPAAEEPQPEAEAPAAEEPKPEAEAPAAEEPAAEAPAEKESEPEKEEKKEYAVPETKTAVIERLKELSHSDKAADKDELELLKKTYYRLRHEEVTAQHDAFISGGGKEEDFRVSPDADEESFKAELSLVREKRAKEHEELEKRKQENLKHKLEILEQIKALSTSPEEANKNYDAFRKLQAEWKEYNPVPAENSTELWKNYQYAVENFYDMLKLNNEFREYDFKKNLEAKTRLCEYAEKLADEPDPVSAFHQMQKLHQEFRELGPVAKDLREQIWSRFKAATTVINKRHQEYFEKLKAQENENLEKKTALCEKVESLEYDGLKTYSDWDKVTEKVKELQAEWKTIGFTPKAMNTKIFERFRKGCDAFFTRKTQYFKDLRSSLNANYARKNELCEKAEALKDSQDWNATASAIRELQKQWKEIGSVPRKHSEAQWKRFSAACNAFFDARHEATASQRESENENLKTKRGIIAELKAITAEAKEGAAEKVQQLTVKWQETGFVPYKYKEKIYQEYHAELDRIYSELNIRRMSARAGNIKARAEAAIQRGGDAVLSARDRLFRQYEAKKSEIQTYENNLGFLNVSSKSGSGFVSEIKRKIEGLKGELDTLRQSIEELDAKAKADEEKPADDAPKDGSAATDKKD